MTARATEQHFRTLGLKRGATEEELKKAYRAKALQFHPDRNPSGADIFKQINTAYEALVLHYKQNGGKDVIRGGGNFGGLQGASSGAAYRHARNNAGSPVPEPNNMYRSAFDDPFAAGHANNGQRRTTPPASPPVWSQFYKAAAAAAASSKGEGGTPTRKPAQSGSTAGKTDPTTEKRWWNAHGGRVPVSGYSSPKPAEPPGGSTPPRTTAHYATEKKFAVPLFTSAPRTYNELKFMFEQLYTKTDYVRETLPATSDAEREMFEALKEAKLETMWENLSKMRTNEEKKRSLRTEWERTEEDLKEKAASSKLDEDVAAALRTREGERREAMRAEKERMEEDLRRARAERERRDEARKTAAAEAERRRGAREEQKDRALDDKRRNLRRLYAIQYTPDPGEVGNMTDIELYTVLELLRENADRVEAVLKGRLVGGPCSRCKLSSKDKSATPFQCEHRCVCKSCATQCLQCPLCGAPPVVEETPPLTSLGPDACPPPLFSHYFPAPPTSTSSANPPPHSSSSSGAAVAGRTAASYSSMPVASESAERDRNAGGGGGAPRSSSNPMWRSHARRSSTPTTTTTTTDQRGAISSQGLPASGDANTPQEAERKASPDWSGASGRPPTSVKPRSGMGSREDPSHTEDEALPPPRSSAPSSASFSMMDVACGVPQPSKTSGGSEEAERQHRPVPAPASKRSPGTTPKRDVPGGSSPTASQAQIPLSSQGSQQTHSRTSPERTAATEIDDWAIEERFPKQSMLGTVKPGRLHSANGTACDSASRRSSHPNPTREGSRGGTRRRETSPAPSPTHGLETTQRPSGEMDTLPPHPAAASLQTPAAQHRSSAPPLTSPNTDLGLCSSLSFSSTESSEGAAGSRQTPSPALRRPVASTSTRFGGPPRSSRVTAVHPNALHRPSDAKSNLQHSPPRSFTRMDNIGSPVTGPSFPQNPSQSIISSSAAPPPRKVNAGAAAGGVQRSSSDARSGSPHQGSAGLPVVLEAKGGGSDSPRGSQRSVSLSPSGGVSRSLTSGFYGGIRTLPKTAALSSKEETPAKK